MRYKNIKTLTNIYKNTILIIEEDNTLTQQLKLLLEEQNFAILGHCNNYQDAVTNLQNLKPDLVIINISLNGEKSGIDLGGFVNENYPSTAFVYLTSSFDKKILECARRTKPDGFLVYPFNELTLLTTIEIALQNKAEISSSCFIPIPEGRNKIYIDRAKIIYIKGERNYVVIHMESKQYLIRITMGKLMSYLDSKCFYQIHKSYIVNTNHIYKVGTSSLHLKDSKIPIGQKYRDVFNNNFSYEEERSAAV